MGVVRGGVGGGARVGVSGGLFLPLATAAVQMKHSFIDMVWKPIFLYT